MSKFFKVILASWLAIFGVLLAPPEPAHAGRSKVIYWNAGNLTADTYSSTYPIAIGPNDPIFGSGGSAFTGRMMVGASVDPVSTASSMNVYVQGSFDKSNWTTLEVQNAAGAATAFTTVTTTAQLGMLRYLPAPPPPYIRFLADRGSNAATINVKMWLSLTE